VRKPNDLIDFSSYIHETPNCWEWLGTKRNGYGRFNYKGKKWSAHRLAYRIYKGEFDESLDICHTCDNPGCVNPRHLFIGTHIDNMRDMRNKGRSPNNKGENNPNVKLSVNDVKDIRGYFINGGMNISELSRKFNVTDTNIRDILNFKTWNHVNNQKGE